MGRPVQLVVLISYLITLTDNLMHGGGIPTMHLHTRNSQKKGLQMIDFLKKLVPPNKEKAIASYGEESTDAERRKILEKEKAEATKHGKPWVAVLDTQVNEKNIRNGFFELDWNNEFIESLLDAGFEGESAEAVVDHWFKNVVAQILYEDGESIDREMGHINIVRNDDGTSEIS